MTPNQVGNVFELFQQCWWKGFWYAATVGVALGFAAGMLAVLSYQAIKARATR